MGRLNEVLRNAKWYEFTDSVLTFSELLKQLVDEQLLFSVVQCTNHCLFPLLEKDNSQSQMYFRPRGRGHSFNLPRYQYNHTNIFFYFQKFIFI